MNDRQIDALIAEKVFGWQRLSADEAYKWTMSQPAPPPARNACRAPAWIFDGNMMACEGCGSLPEFTANPGDSQRLREKLAERFTYYSLDWLRTNGEPGFCFAVHGENEEIFRSEFEATEEMAVAKAALLTVGVKV